MNNIVCSESHVVFFVMNEHVAYNTHSTPCYCNRYKYYRMVTKPLILAVDFHMTENLVNHNETHKRFI